MIVFTISGALHSWYWFTLNTHSVSFIKSTTTTTTNERSSLLCYCYSSTPRAPSSFQVVFYLPLILTANFTQAANDTLGIIINLPEYPSPSQGERIPRVTRVIILFLNAVCDVLLLLLNNNKQGAINPKAMQLHSTRSSATSTCAAMELIYSNLSLLLLLLLFYVHSCRQSLLLTCYCCLLFGIGKKPQ